MTTNELNQQADFNPAKHPADAGFRNSEPSHAAQKSDVVFLSLHQAAKMTGYHQDYLGQMARSGKLEAIKVGRNWQTTKLAIDKMLGRVPKEEPKPAVQPVVHPAAKIEAPKVFAPKPIVTEPAKVMASEIPRPVISQISKPVAVHTQVPQPKILEPVKIVSEKPATPISISKPVAINISKPEPVVEKIEPKISAPEPVFTPRVNIAQKVMVRHLATSADAGPNVQELIATYAHDETVSLKDVDLENREKLFRWNKLAPKFSNNRNSYTSNRFTEFTQQYPEKVEQVELKKSKPIWAYAAAGVTTIILLAAGYVGSTYLNTPQEQNLNLTESPEKRVAGESTSITEPITGKATIPQNATELIVKDDSIDSDSTILVTFRADYAGRYWVSGQKDGEFTLKLSESVKEQIEFSYMILAEAEGETP